MKITEEIFRKIVSEPPLYPPETGGILGGKDQIVTCFYADSGMQSARMCAYIPNIKVLNSIIRTWQEKGVSFYGLYHTHFFGVRSLSEQDKNYMNALHAHLSDAIETLYFPIIVLPQRDMVVYSSKRRSEGYDIVEEPVEFVP